MLNYIVILICFLFGLIISFFCGYLTAKLTQKFNKEDKLSYVLEQFKNEIKNLAQKNDLNTNEFKSLLGYLNTSVNEQQKGIGGDIK